MDKNSLFKHTLVLSLPHREDRQMASAKELEKLDINYQFFHAVNGHEIETKQPLLPGEYGIKLSHIKILEKAIENKLESIFIFEDDIVLHNSIVEILERNYKFLDEAQFIYLGGSHRGPISNVGGDVYKASDLYTTHAMWIHHSMFEEAIETLKFHPFQQLDNCYVILQKKYTCLTIYPNIAYQKDGYSDIQNKLVSYEWLR